MLPNNSERPAEDCCPAYPQIAGHFDRRMREAAESGALPEMVEVSKALLALLDDVGDVRPTVLELGCGSAALMVSLLERGAVSADGVDLSAESIATAHRRAEAAGVESRANFVNGDGSTVPVEAHDWVVLDRVMCCYPNLDGLLANSVGAARSRYAFSVPESRGWRGVVNRAIRITENSFVRLGAEGCQGYTHSIDKVERSLRQSGFRLLREKRVGLWYAAVFERSGNAAA